MIDRKKIGIWVKDLAEWQRIASLLGYGSKSKYKLLRKLLRYAEEHKSLFSSDSIL